MLFASGAAMVMPTPTCSSGSAASTSATSCSSRTSTSAGGSGCSATGSGTCPSRSSTTVTTRRWTSFGAVARALPARAQRAVHDLQELRRREPARASCRPRSCSPSGAASTLGGDDPHTLDLRTGERRRAGRPDQRPRSRRSPSAVRDRRLRRAARRAWPRPARELQAARRRADQEILPAVPPAVPPEHRRLRTFVDGFDAVVDAFGVEDSVHRAAADPRRHRRHARSRRWPAPRSAPGRSRARCAASTTSSSSARSSADDISHPDFRVRKVNGHRAQRARRLVRRRRSSRAT